MSDDVETPVGAAAASFASMPGDEPGVWVVKAKGEIDVAATAAFRHELQAAVDNGASTILVDLEQTTFIDSSGLGVLVGALKRLRDRQPDGRIVLSGLDGSVAKVFEITGLTALFQAR